MRHVSVKLWPASTPIPLCAVNDIGKVPCTVDVPLKVPVPLPLSVKVTPAGSGPDSTRDGAGGPVDVTVNVPSEFTAKVALLALVNAGAWFTDRVKFCVALEPTPFNAVKLIGYTPPIPAAGVPLSTPVVVLNVTPVGSNPVSVKVGAGSPVAVTVKVPGAATVNVVLLALVIAGA